jgi:hypothetical protein
VAGGQVWDNRLLKLQPQLEHQKRFEAAIHSLKRELFGSQNLCFSFMCFASAFLGSFSFLHSFSHKGHSLSHLLQS